MSTFNERVTALVNRYLRNAGGASAPERVRNAFATIKADRQMSCLNDSVTVAAEHYLFTRYLTSSNLLIGTAYFSGSILINLTYDAVKELMKLFGGDIGVTACPTSEAHCWIRMWSLMGAGDGYGDRGETTPASPTPSDTGFALVCYPHAAP